MALGSYERIVFGTDFDLEKDGENYKLKSAKDSFAVPAHIASVRSVGSCRKYLVSGSTDETIKIFDLRKRKDIGSVVEHSGSITSLSFYESSHLLTGSEDGKVALFRTSDWECLHVFPHKAPVSSVAVHPSGKLVISISTKQKSLRLWNLVTGKAAGKAKMTLAAERVLWSPSGEHYALQSERAVVVYSAKSTTNALYTVDSATRILCSALIDDQTLLLAGEGSQLQVVNLAAGKTTRLDLGQKPRIKDMALVEGLLVTVASEGSVALWSLAALNSASDGSTPEAIARHSIQGLRPICMTATIQ